jgi:hypothetical protein
LRRELNSHDWSTSFPLRRTRRSHFSPRTTVNREGLLNSFAVPQVQAGHEPELEEAALLRTASSTGLPLLRRIPATVCPFKGYEASPGAIRDDQERRQSEVGTSRSRQAKSNAPALPVAPRAEQNQAVLDNYALMPNPSVNLTRYGRRRKPGLSQLYYCLSPGLQHLPTRAGYLER